MENAVDLSPARWSLADLFPAHDHPQVQQTLDSLKERLEAFELMRSRLAADIPVEDFLGIVRQYEGMTYDAYRLNSYANLFFNEDTQNAQAQTFLGQIEQFLAEAANRTLFFTLWWKDLDDADAARLMTAAPAYYYWLEVMRHYKPHTLSEAEEKIVNLKNVTGIKALQRLYETITNRYTYRLEVDGEVKELTRGELMVYVRLPDAGLRARAYQEMYRVFTQDGPILGQVYQYIARDWKNENVDTRKFAEPISVRNLDNDIPDEVIQTLLAVCEQNAPLFQRFFRLKARWLGVDRLRRYDLYAPVVQSDRQYPFSEAAGLVFDSFEGFDPQVAALARRVFAENHVDSEVRKGKMEGAFCWTATHDLDPWVLLNYQGRADDVATMAHELGHAIHGMLTRRHNIFTYHPCLPLAETASTFAEMLLVDRMLDYEQDESVRRDLLFRQVDDAYATIMRQAFFALFERQAHEMIRQGASVEDLSQAYFENLQRQFGDSLELSDEFRWEWAAIWHFFNVPFYVYAYAFGQLLVLALYKQYKSQGEAFKPRYLELLAAGGSDAPMRILERAGIDATQAAFWQGGFDVIRDMIEKLEAIPVA
jgi:oligoendopeptidase F